MRTLRIIAHTSLDGVIQQDNDNGFPYGNWTGPYRTTQGLAMLMEAQGSPYDLLLGRLTYDAWSKVWPNGQGPMAESLNSATKYVVTHRPESLEWGPVHAIGNNLIESVRALKATDGPVINVWGSSTFISQLLEHDLVDELIVAVYPVLLGQGKRLFSTEASARELAFVDTKTTPTGVLLNTYRYVGALKA